MSDNIPVEQPGEPIWIEIELPGGLARDYERLVENGVYSDLKIALLHAILESWRHNKGVFHTVRIDVRSDEPPAGESELASDGSVEASED